MPRRLLVPLEQALIRWRGEGLFDAAFYLEQNTDVARARQDAFRHYLLYGWQEGRAPNPRFDDGYYRAEAGLGRKVPVSALAHFLAFGRENGLCPVPGIDLGTYRARTPGLRVSRIDPYRHLVETNPGPAPGPDLDAAMLGLDGLNPPKGSGEVNVIVPIYLGRAETLNTLHHALRARNRTSFSVTVINDASPDEALADDLRALAARGLVTLIENQTNKGFVGSVNQGSRLQDDKDVIWLNADTEVYDGWIDRLRAAARSRPDVATVTPLTNNGTICSYPRFNADNPGALETPWRKIDALAARFNAGDRVETPTCVGFCVYVPRAALDAIGELDEAAFGRGYGEENDFSRRAVARGWVNLIATDVVVRHFGATSFRDSRADRIEAALKVLDRRYPGYRSEISNFLADDPVAPHRRKLDLARLSTLAQSRNVLIVTHARGGGTQQHVQEETARLTSEGASTFLLTGAPGGGMRARLSHADAGPLPSLASIDLSDDWIWKALIILGISEVHIHHLVDFGPEAPRLFARRLEGLSIPYEFVVHDYLSVCPRVNMVDLGGFYCGEPNEAGCQRCLDRRGSDFGHPVIGVWRAGYHELLRAARRVRVPDRDASDRLFSYFPDLAPMDIVPHERMAELAPKRPQPRRPGPLRIAVLGAIGPIKGFDVLLDLARHVREAGEEAEFTVVGYTRSDTAARTAGIRITGPYQNAEVQDLIAREDPDVIWIPSLWPETYCYTLSIAFQSGRPVAAFAVGALATRVRATGTGYLMALETARHPERVWQGLQIAARPVDAEGLDLAS